MNYLKVQELNDQNDAKRANNTLVVSALMQLTIVARPTCLKRGYKALELLSQHYEVLVYKHLHTKLTLENSAIVTSANLTRTSLLKNLETGIYYDNALFLIRLYAEEVVLSATRYIDI
ncbi:MAG: hypothetical protein DRJ64_01150 [Thermoprotei archaeon]|nr:MAG: hypothetical protein DRJ64_01150 [Thermoprotei archaeon]